MPPLGRGRTPESINTSHRRQHRVIYAAFILNVIISLLAVITYATQCIPFAAIYKTALQATAKCYPPDILVKVTQINGSKRAMKRMSISNLRSAADCLWNNDSPFLCCGYHHSSDPTIFTLECRHVTKNENDPQHNLWSRHSDRTYKHWSGRHDNLARSDRGLKL